MTPTKSIPPPNPTDSGEVTEALEVAGKLWATGNQRDAIRWLRRAAQAADEAGNPQRMSALALASAALEESLAATPPVRASVPPPLPQRPKSSLPPPPESASRMRAKSTPPPLPPQVSRTAAASTAPQKNGSRFRVSIKTSTLDPAILIIRRLEDGKALPAGTSEGWLETSKSANVDGAAANGKSVP